MGDDNYLGQDVWSKEAKTMVSTHLLHSRWRAWSAIALLFVLCETSQGESIECAGKGLLGRVQFQNYALNFELDEDTLYVASTVSGTSAVFEIYDISDLQQPQLIGTTNFTGQPTLVRLVDKYAYVFDRSSDIEIFDVSDPAIPQSVNVYNSDYGGGLFSFDVQGTMACIGGREHFQVLDLSDPAAPVRVGSWILPHFERGTDIRMIGDTVFLCTEGGTFGDRLRTFNITNPAMPQPIDDLPGGRSMQIIGNIAYAISSDRLRVIDISNPAALVQLSQFDDIRGGDISIEGERAIVLSGFPHVLAIRSPYEIQSLGYIPMFVSPSMMKLRGDVGYFMGGLLSVHDLNQYSHGMIVDEELEAREQERPDMFVADDVAYVAANNRGVHIFDVSDIATLRPVAQYAHDNAQGVHVSEDLLFVVGGTTLEIVDVSTPSSPDFISSVDVGPSPTIVSSKDNYAYIGSSTAPRLRIVDVSDAQAPALLGTFPGSGLVYDIAASGDQVYLGTTSGLFVIDVSDPSMPTQLGFTSAVRPTSIAVINNYLFTTRIPPSLTESGIIILDVSNPATPTIVSSYNPLVYDSIASILTVDGNILYAGGSTTLKIDFSDPFMPTLLGFEIQGADFGGLASGGLITLEGFPPHRYTYVRSFKVDECVVCASDIGSAGGAMTDGRVDASDLFVLLANWGMYGYGAEIASPTNVVDFSDLFELLAAWGECS